MSEFYEMVNQLNPDNRNLALTVIDGEAFGEKALLSGRNMIWRTKGSRFFPACQKELEQIGEGGLYTVGGQRVFCELLGQEKSW